MRPANLQIAAEGSFCCGSDSKESAVLLCNTNCLVEKSVVRALCLSVVLYSPPPHGQAIHPLTIHHRVRPFQVFMYNLLYLGVFVVRFMTAPSGRLFKVLQHRA
jgi:hypothetical protein